MSDAGKGRAEPSAQTLAPRVIGGRYTLGVLIGRGSMGAVYRAQHTLTHQEVALKLICPTPANHELVRARFAREVGVSAWVGHGGIVQVLDAGEEPDGTLYLAMELLRGQTLQDRAQHPDFTASYGLNVLRALLEPLAAAHDAGIVHRDLKPENIFLHRCEQGREQVKLLDFGIATDPRQRSSTRTDVGLGTPFYMSPEQATSARDVTPASDVWSVGVMLYWLLSGRLPFDGETPFNTLTQVCTVDPAPIEARGGHTTQRLIALTQEVLHKNPNHRPQDAGQLLRAFDDILGPLTSQQSLSSVHSGSNPELGAPWSAPGAASRSSSAPVLAWPPVTEPRAAAMASLTLSPALAARQRWPVRTWVWIIALLCVGAGAGWIAGFSDPSAPAPVEAAPAPPKPARAAPPQPMAPPVERVVPEIDAPAPEPVTPPPPRAQTRRRSQVVDRAAPASPPAHAPRLAPEPEPQPQSPPAAVVETQPAPPAPPVVSTPLPPAPAPPPPLRATPAPAPRPAPAPAKKKEQPFLTF